MNSPIFSGGYAPLKNPVMMTKIQLDPPKYMCSDKV